VLKVCKHINQKKILYVSTDFWGRTKQMIVAEIYEILKFTSVVKLSLCIMHNESFSSSVWFSFMK